MPKIIVVQPKHIKRIKGLAFILLVAGTMVFFWKGTQNETALAPPDEERVIHMVAGSFIGKNKDQQPYEVYRWDPGTIVVQEGETVRLTILGVAGKSHPFMVDGLNIKGEVKQGEETTVTFKATKPGIYRIICLSHPDQAHQGPMIGYLVVTPS